MGAYVYHTRNLWRRILRVTNIPAYSTASVAQMVFAHILNITQRVGYYADENKQGRWTKNADFCYWDTQLVELQGKKMGIVGFGNIGQATARIAQAFGMEVCVYSSKPQFVLPSGIKKMDLDELFAECDVISLHCPLTPDTKEMVNAERLNKMKSNAILINTGRGPLINEQDLADALNSGQIAAAGLDVLCAEDGRFLFCVAYDKFATGLSKLRELPADSEMRTAFKEEQYQKSMAAAQRNWPTQTMLFSAGRQGEVGKAKNVSLGGITFSGTLRVLNE